MCASDAAFQTGTLTSTNHGAEHPQTAGQADGTFEDRWKACLGKRGTSDLLLSCFATVGLAVWLSVILNVQMTADRTISQIVKHQNQTLWEKLKLQLILKHVLLWKYKHLCAIRNVMV